LIKVENATGVTLPRPVSKLAQKILVGGLSALGAVALAAGAALLIWQTVRYLRRPLAMFA
jgi:hypothetical protein